MSDIVEAVLEKGFMSCKFRPLTILLGGLCAAVLLGMAGACSKEYYKAEADEEVYRIIDGKWQDSFGQKANYTISDVPPSPNDIQIEKAIPQSGPISLAQAAAIATAHNRDYQSQKESLYKKALTLTGERYKYELQWFATIDGTYIDDKSKTSQGDYDDLSIQASGGISRTELLLDGAIVNAGIAIDWMRFLTGDPRTTLASVLSADFTIPLLGAGAGRVALENLTQAERSVLYQIRTFNRYRQTFVVSIVNDYYRVLQQRDAVTNAENDYKRRVESKERLEMEAQAGRRNRFEVDQAEQDVLRARDQYVQAQQRYKQQLDEFKIRLSLPTDADVELDQNELKALEEIGISEPNYAPEEAVEAALVRRLDLANSRDAVDDAARKVELAADGLGVQLNLVGSAGVESNPKTDFSRLQFHEGIYTLGGEADLPLSRKTQRNAYREALITLTQQQRTFENDVDEVKLDVRQAYRQLQEAAERYRIQKNSLDLAEKRVESTALLLEAGRSTTRDLLDAQDALLEAQNAVTAALVGHAVAKLSFFRDIGVLQVKPDGMWE
jgi:outer membrane protein TolC